MEDQMVWNSRSTQSLGDIYVVCVRDIYIYIYRYVRSLSFPKRTWKGELCRLPELSETTITSIAPDNVALFRLKSDPKAPAIFDIHSEYEYIPQMSEPG